MQIRRNTKISKRKGALLATTKPKGGNISSTQHQKKSFATKKQSLAPELSSPDKKTKRAIISKSLLLISPDEKTSSIATKETYMRGGDTVPSPKGIAASTSIQFYPSELKKLDRFIRMMFLRHGVIVSRAKIVRTIIAIFDETDLTSVKRFVDQLLRFHWEEPRRIVAPEDGRRKKKKKKKA